MIWSFIFISILIIVSETIKITLLLKKEAKHHFTDKPTYFSIIICFRNQADLLLTNLPQILNQEQSNFEIILIDDFSTLNQNKESLLLKIVEKNQNLNYYKLRDYLPKHLGKKQAISFGIKKAKYKHILLTDSDCYPSSKKWVSRFCESYNANTSIILGYGKYKRLPGLLNKLIRFDTHSIALDYFAWTKLGFPYMAVGRNLSYTKMSFKKNKGFASHEHLDSGDDDLLIAEISTSKNTSILFDHDSSTTSFPEKTYYNWIKQKSRHISTASYYPKKNQLITLFNYSSKFTWWVLLLICIFTYNNLPATFYIFLFTKLTVSIATYYTSLNKTKESDLIPYALILEFVVLLFYPVFHLGKYLIDHKRK